MSAPADPPGPRPALREGRYVLLGPLGAGSQGTTWDAVDRREGRAVAIKRFDVRGATSWKDVELAEREARVVESLDHPTLPRYVEHFEEGGALYLVMEKIEGVPLSELKGKMSDADVLRLLHDADGALAYLHGRSPPVFHRDLKPSNVIRRPDGSFAFVDFGAVRDRLRPQGGSTVVGTFGYMAPEQFQGRAGPGSDVYAIGATALAVLTGSEPEELPHRGLGIDVNAALGGRSRGGLRAMLEKMLEVDPDARPTRIGPLLERRVDRPAEGEAFGRALEREIRDDVERKVREHVERVTRRAERHARRSGRRAEERARRKAERDAMRAAFGGDTRRRQRRGPPWFVWLFVLVGLVVAQLAVTVTMRIAVPVVLVALSILFGRKLRSAAWSVARAGERAQEAMTEAIHHVGGAADASGSPGAAARESDAPRTRVADEGEAGRVRVDTPEAWADDDSEHEATPGAASGQTTPRRRG